MSEKYVRVTKGLYEKGQLVKPDKVFEIVTDDQDYYVSTYYYTPEHYKQFQQTHSVKGMRDLTTNKVWFDYDKEGDFESARKDAVEVVSRLKEIGIEEQAIQVYFSGSKGINVVVDVDKDLNRQQVEHFCYELSGDLETFDKSMYDFNQLLRIAGTKHQKTKKFKIPLTIDQLEKASHDEIKAIASNLDNVGEFNWTSAKIPDEMVQVKQTKKENKSVNFDSNQRPKGWPEYKWRLLHAEGLKAGQRSDAMIVIAATCRGLGYGETITEKMLEAFDQNYSTLTGQDEDPGMIQDKLSSVFSGSWQGGQFNFENNMFLKEYVKTLGIKVEKENNPVMRIHDIENQFTDYVANIEKNTIKTGIERLDKAVPITIGMNMGIVGAASSGKTALALEILKNTSQAGIVSVFVSLDMARIRLFEKMLMKVTGQTRDDIYKQFKSGSTKDIMNKVKHNFGNVYFYDRSAPTVDSVRAYIEEVEAKSGQKVKLVMLDYFERVNAEKSDETAASKEVAGKLQDLVADMQIAMITLCQPNKFSLSGGPDAPLTSYTAIKGSSFLYQSFRSILSIWRPFFNPETKDKDHYLQMGVLKNDLGELGIFNFAWNGRKGEISEMTDEEHEEFKKLLAIKQKSKGGDDDGGWS